jgi:hypothetical protein
MGPGLTDRTEEDGKGKARASLLPKSWACNVAGLRVTALLHLKPGAAAFALKGAVFSAKLSLARRPPSVRFLVNLAQKVRAH